jgi:hypothetical protein
MIRAIMIVEIAGRPAEHVKESLEKHVGGLKAFKDIKVNNLSVSEPKALEEIKDAFTCFAEVDFSVETFGRLCDTVFDFMPSSIEILEPSKIDFTNLEATSLLNIVSGRMHKYDEITRFANFRMEQTLAQLNAIQGNKEEVFEDKSKKKIAEEVRVEKKKEK